MKREVEINRLLLFLAALTLFVPIFMISFYFPKMVTDDYLNTLAECETVWNILIGSMIRAHHEYFRWVGSPAIQSVSNIFCTLPKIYFDIFISLSYIVLTGLICKNIVGTQKITWHLFLLIGSLLFVLAPIPGQTIFWITGSFYMWSLVPALLLLLYFRFYDEKETAFSPSLFFLPWIALLSLFSGNIHGAGGGVCFLTILGYIIIWSVQRKKIPAWAYVSLLLCLAGTIIMVFSPGNMNRIMMMQHDTQAADYGAQLMQNFKSVFSFSIYPLCILILSLYFALRHIKMFRLRYILLYLCPAFIGMGVYILTVSELRTFFFFTVFTLISIGVIYVQIPKTHLSKDFRLLLILICLCLFGYITARQYFYTFQISPLIEQRLKYIQAKVSEGHLEILVPNYEKQYFYGKTSALSDVREDCNNPYNVAFANILGADSILGRDVPENLTFQAQIQWLEENYPDSAQFVPRK